MNCFVLLGTMVSKPHNFTRDALSYAEFEVKVERNYRNNDGENVYDVFKVILWRGISEITAEKYPVGTTVSIKGRMELRDQQICLIAERVSFVTQN